MARIKAYNFYIKCEPTNWSRKAYVKHRCQTLEEALAVAEADAKRTGKTFNVVDKENKLIRKFESSQTATAV